LDPLLFLFFFSYGAVEITSLETNKVLKVNGHRLKPFYESWTTELTASVELAEPIYEEWASNISSQWHKTKELTGRQPSTKREKKNRFAFFFPYLLLFAFYFIFVILLYSFSFISTLRTMLCFKCGGIGRMLVFLFWFSLLFQKQKNKKKQISMFDLSNSYWFMRLWVLYMRINWDRWRYKSNEWVCMQVLRFNWFRDWLWKYVMLTL